MGLLFVESIRRLFKDDKVSKEKVLELFQNGKITEEQKWYIFNVETEKSNDMDVNLEVK